MSCKEIEKLLNDYIDATLVDDERVRVEEHVQRCSACAEMLDTMRRAAEAVSGLEKRSAPRDFTAALMEQIGKPARQPEPVRPAASRTSILLRVGLPLAAAVVLALSFYVSPLFTTAVYAPSAESVAVLSEEEDLETVREEFLEAKRHGRDDTASHDFDPELTYDSKRNRYDPAVGKDREKGVAGGLKKEAAAENKAALFIEERKEADESPDAAKTVDEGVAILHAEMKVQERIRRSTGEQDDRPAEAEEERSDESKTVPADSVPADVEQRDKTKETDGGKGMGRPVLVDADEAYKVGVSFMKSDPDSGVLLNCLIVDAAATWKEPVASTASPGTGGPSGPRTPAPGSTSTEGLSKNGAAMARTRVPARRLLAAHFDDVKADYSLFEVDEKDYQTLVKRYVDSGPTAVHACAVKLDESLQGEADLQSRGATGGAGFLTGRGRKQSASAEPEKGGDGFRQTIPVTLWSAGRPAGFASLEEEAASKKKERRIDASLVERLDRVLQRLPKENLFMRAIRMAPDVEAKKREKPQESKEGTLVEESLEEISSEADARPRKRTVIVIVFRNPDAAGKEDK